MPIDRSKFTHDAYIFKREGVRKGRPLGYWQAEGVGREQPNGDFFVYLHSTPVGGLTGVSFAANSVKRRPPRNSATTRHQPPPRKPSGVRVACDAYRADPPLLAEDPPAPFR